MSGLDSPDHGAFILNRETAPSYWLGGTQLAMTSVS